jgi:hypothetical protein
MSKPWFVLAVALVACDGTPVPSVGGPPAPFDDAPSWDDEQGPGGSAWCDDLRAVEDTRSLFAPTVDPVRQIGAGKRLAAMLGTCRSRMSWFDRTGGFDVTFDRHRVAMLSVQPYQVTDRRRSFETESTLGLGHNDGGTGTGRPLVLREGLPWDAIARSRQRSTRAHLRVDPDRRWVTVDAELVIAADRGAPLLFETVVPRRRADGNGDYSHGMRVIELTQDGEARPRQWVGSLLAVQPKAHDGEVRLHLRAEGIPFVGAGDYLTVDTGRLARILPVIPGSTPQHDVTLEVPVGFEVIAEGAAAAAAPAGWRGYHIRGGAPFVARVRRARAAPAQTLALPGVTVAIDGELDDDQVAALRAMATRLAALAPAPRTDARLVVSPREGEVEATPVVDAAWIEVPGRPGDATTPPTHAAYDAARALAGWWLRGVVPIGERRPVRWCDAVAAYLALGAVAPDAAMLARRDWAVVGAQLWWWRVTTAADLSHEDAGRLAGRAVLHLVALEDRVGAEAVDRGLRSFLAARRGQPSRWEDLLAGMRAADPDGWLARTLEQPGAPRLTLDGVARRGARITGTLVQERAADLPRFEGTVEVAALAGTAVVARTRVPYGDERTPFALDAAGADRVVIDPDFRLPRRFDPGTDPTLDQVAIALPAP